MSFSLAKIRKAKIICSLASSTAVDCHITGLVKSVSHTVPQVVVAFVAFEPAEVTAL